MIVKITDQFLRWEDVFTLKFTLFVLKNNILSSGQSGFMQGGDAIFQLTLINLVSFCDKNYCTIF